MEAPVLFYVNSTCPGINLKLATLHKITNDGTHNFAVFTDGSSYQINDADLNAFYTRLNTTLANASAIVF